MFFGRWFSHSLGLFPTLHLDILDFVSTVCEKKAGCRKQFETEKKHILSKTPEPLPVHAIVDTIGSYINHFNDPKDKPVIKVRKEGNVLFNDTLNTFYLRLHGVRHMVKDHSDSERGNPLPPHGLLFSINSKGSFICTVPQTG